VSVIAVRALTADDAAWAAGLMERRRQLYAGYSPVFWRPRPGVTGPHARFLGRQLSSPGYLALRTEHGFLIGQRRDQEAFVDDFAVERRPAGMPTAPPCCCPRGAAGRRTASTRYGW
jgi:hypothetical protein